MSLLRLHIRRDDDDPSAALVLVDGWVGERPYPFLLDTGAATTTLKTDSYTVTFPTVGTRASGGVFSRDEEELVRAPPIRVGPLSSEALVVSRKASGVLFNLLGMDVLGAYRLEFRFAETSVLVDEPFPAVVAHPLVTSDAGHPFVPVHWGAREARAVWDAGASLTVGDARFIANHPADFAPAGASMGTDSNGTESPTPVFTMVGATVGGVPLAPHRVAAVDLTGLNGSGPPVHLILGYNSIRQATWLFDFPAARWAVWTDSPSVGPVDLPRGD